MTADKEATVQLLQLRLTVKIPETENYFRTKGQDIFYFEKILFLIIASVSEYRFVYVSAEPQKPYSLEGDFRPFEAKVTGGYELI